MEEGSRSEREALEALVSAEAEAAREVGGNVAEGLSDLNPETRERMAALAAENEQLRQAVDAQTADRVQRLEDELEDACAGKKTFEEVRVQRRGVCSCVEESRGGGGGGGSQSSLTPRGRAALPGHQGGEGGAGDVAVRCA